MPGGQSGDPLSDHYKDHFENWLTPRGLTEAVQVLPPDRAQAFHHRFLAGAASMESAGTVTLDFAATLHRATKPA